MENNDFYKPLIVSLTPSDIRHHYPLNEVLPAHDFVIRPLLVDCKEAFVYGIKKESELYRNNSEILINDGGKFKFDNSKECIKGHEYLWNVTRWERGSIVLILEINRINFPTIFKYCYRPGLNATPNSGNTLAATKKCKVEALKGNIGICFSASNGIEWISIYANNDLTREILLEARKHCQETGYWSKK